ncbi:Peroxin-3 [Syncephalis plumigaleata]|nr:Peroxin-3 [Syncephalis plumigaleata]
MLQRIWDFTKRHQRGLLITAGIAGSVYATTRFIRNKLTDFQRNSSQEMARQADLKRRFEQNQTDCLFTVMALLPALVEQLDNELDVNGITMRLRQGRQQSVSQSMSTSIGPGNDFVKVNENSQQQQQEQQEPQENDTSNERESSTTEGDRQHGSTSSVGSDSGNEMAAASFIEENTIDSPVELHPLDRFTKLELWQELKIRSFTRTIAATYLITLLTLLNHLQLNLVGRHIYVASVAESGVEASKETEASVRLRMQRNDTVLAANTERDYLSFSWWLLHVGCYTCIQRIRNATIEVIGSVSLKKSCSYQDLSNLVNQIRDRVESSSWTSSDSSTSIFDGIRGILLPDDDEDVLCVLQEAGIINNTSDTADNAISPELRRLLDETRDFIDSPDFTTVLARCLDESFGLLLNRLQSSLFPDPLPDLQLTTSSIHELTASEEAAMKKQIPLAKLLPDVSRQVHEILNGVPNTYLELISNTETLRAYSAIVYSAYDTPSWL